MAVGLFTDPIFYKIGTGDFLHSFFSTIAYRLENNKWGSRFPTLMNKLYNDDIEYNECKSVEEELSIIKKEFAKLSPDKIIWNINDLSQQPPWKDNIADRITSLANYFWTSDGKDMFEVFERALKASIEIKEKLIIRSI